jgi:sulfur carrier protein ThiS
VSSENERALLTFRGKRYQVAPGMTLRDAIRKVGLSPEAILATRGAELLTDDIILRPGEEIRLVAVISGGSFRAWP